MTDKGRGAIIVGVIGGLASVPLVLVLGAMFGNKLEAELVLALGGAPVYIGVLASAWWLALSRWMRVGTDRAILLGGATGVLAFLSFAATVALLPPELGLLSGREGFYVVGAIGFVLFGWIPVIAGGFAGWTARRGT